MGRVIQPKETKGSLKWIQYVVNNCPDVLSNPIINAIGANREESLEWFSPKADDDYAEYRDQAFLDLFGIEFSKTKLKDFWPKREKRGVRPSIKTAGKPTLLIKWLLNDRGDMK